MSKLTNWIISAPGGVLFYSCFRDHLAWVVRCIFYLSGKPISTGLGCFVCPLQPGAICDVHLGFSEPEAQVSEEQVALDRVCRFMADSCDSSSCI